MARRKSVLKKIGSVIRYHRKKMGMTQTEFGNIVGMHRTYIGAVERGERNFSVLKFYDLASALGKEVKDIVEYTE